MSQLPVVRLRPAPLDQRAKNPKNRLVLSARQMRDSARQWHRDTPEFTLDILNQMGRAETAEEKQAALLHHREALDIGFWSKKDIVQYVVACLHARGSMLNIGSFRSFLEGYSDADEDIMQIFIDAQPVHYWTYAADKAARGAGGSA